MWHRWKLFIVVILVMCLFLVILSLAARLVLPGKSLQQAKVIEALTRAQQDALHAQQFALLSAEHQNAILRMRQAPLWGTLWRVLLVLFSVTLVTAASVFVMRKSCHKSVITTEIEGHPVSTIIPIIDETKEERYLYASAQLARNLALAQGEVNEQTRQMIQTIGKTIKEMSSVVPKHAAIPLLSRDLPALSEGVIPQDVSAPSLATLLDDGTLAPGKPLIIGYSQGEPQYSLLSALKTLAVTGWQGSGKTLSVAYLVATAVLAYAGDILCVVLDPHRNHAEGLSSYLGPLQERGLIEVPNLFYFSKIWDELNARLDRRLSGQEPSSPHVLIIADEMGNLLRRDTQGLMVKFLDRATEETRKTEMTFVGVSHKWTARHFQGHADIRRCMSSLLIHKTKASNAEMLLEDAGKEVKHQLKQIRQPGEGLFVRDYGEPIHIRMPFTRKDDIGRIAEMVSNVVMTRAQDETEPYDITPRGKVLDPAEIQEKIRAVLSSDLRLKDIYHQAFVAGHETPMLTESTFLTKFKDPDRRPWNSMELELLSQWVLAFYGAAC